MGLFDAIGGVLGTDKTGEALAAQQAGGAEAARIQKEMYDQSRADLASYRDAGESALAQMQDPSYLQKFTMSDFQSDPGYQFRMDEANKAIERSAASKGGLMGGAAAKALTNYNQNAASQEYQNAYDRFYNDKNQAYSKLSGLAGMGQSAASQTANNAMSYGNSMSDLYTGLGNAAASAQIGQANLNAQMFNGLVQAGGSMGTAAIKYSDARLKEKIKPVSKAELDEMRKCVKAVKYFYTNGDYGKGEQFGLLIQDLEKSKVGKTLVKEDADGHKMIDVGTAVTMWLASGAEA